MLLLLFSGGGESAVVVDPAVAAIVSEYRSALQEVGEDVIIRRYSGSGPDRTHTDYTARARVIDGVGHDLSGSHLQRERSLIVLAADLEDADFDLPITNHDTVFIDGRELAITIPDDNSRRVAGTVIAYEIKARA